MSSPDPVPPALHEVLERSRAWGFLGPGPVADHVEHAGELSVSLRAQVRENAAIMDLGSGGGVPGLVVAAALPHSSWVLLDANQRRTEFLAWAVEHIGLDSRVEVVRARAEEAGRDPRWRGAFDAVVARSFGPPAVTAECAAPFLHVGGVMAVSEPPESDRSRWPEAGLAALGFAPQPVVADRWALFRVASAVADRYPRPTGRPTKRPLW